MWLSKADREKLTQTLVEMVEAMRTVEDCILIIKLGKKPAHKKADTFEGPLTKAVEGLRKSINNIGGMLNPTEEAKALTDSFCLEALTQAPWTTTELAREFIDAMTGPVTALDELVEALEDPATPPARHDLRAWCYLEDGLIHIEISDPMDHDAEPEMVGSFRVDEVEKAHEFLVKANVATGMYSSSCFHPDEYGLPEDLDVQEWVRKARHWNG